MAECCKGEREIIFCHLKVCIDMAAIFTFKKTHSTFNCDLKQTSKRYICMCE